MLPLYGSGAVMMLWVSLPFQDSLILTYISGVIGATALEYVTGYVMERPGALAAAGAWLLFSALFSVYVNHFAKGLALYGSLTTMVLTMLWVYACVSIVFYGAFFNRLLAQYRQNRT